MERKHAKTYGMQQKQCWGKFTVIKKYIMKKERSQINNWIFYLKELEDREQAKHKVSKREDKSQIRNKWDIE